jgi:hypothetical protein
MPKARFISRIEHELSVICEDRPGMLSRLAKLLGDANVNIVAMSCSPTGVQGAVRLVVDDAGRAKAAFDREHLSYGEHDVLYVELPDVPGALAEFAGKLAAHNINITTAYGTAAKGGKKAVIIFKLSELEEAASLQ